MKKIIGVILLIISIIYIVGVVFFNIYTFPNTIVNGEKVGIVRKEELTNTDFSDFSITIKGKNSRSDIITATDINYIVTLEKPVDIKQNSFLWVFNISKPHKYTIKYNIDFSEGKLTEWIKNSKLNKNTIKTENATIKMSDDKFVIVPEVQGDELNQEKFKESILNAFTHQIEEIVLEGEYISPEIMKDDKQLLAELNFKNEIVNVEIKFDFEDRTEKISGTEIIDFYEHENNEFVLNKVLARSFVADLAKKYDTFGIDRTFETTGKGPVLVTGGIYGWQMNVDKTLDLLLAKIEKRESGTIIPEYNLKGLTRAEDDIGTTYIEIDLTRQKLWFYKEGNLILESDIISGLPTAERETPTGAFKVWSRERDRNLTGEDYSSPVSYWMPINWGGVGLHDASWQSSFGGTLYRTLGSRGCINLPLNIAAKIYEEVKIDTPVIVYKS